MRSLGAQISELLRLERARARRRHRDQLERAPHAPRTDPPRHRRSSAREPKQQLRRSAARGNQTHADFHEPHVQLGMRLNAIRVQRELAAAAERETERRDDDRKRAIAECGSDVS